MKSNICFLFFVSIKFCLCAQNSFVYNSDTIINDCDINFSNQYVMNVLKNQKCFNKNKEYNALFCYNLNLTKSLGKEDFLSKRFMSYLQPTYQYLDKKYLSKEEKKMYKNHPKLLKLLQVDDGVIYELGKPIATTDIKWVYCYIPSDLYYLNLLSYTQNYHIVWWFRLQDSVSGEKFVGIIGLDENNNLWAKHVTKGEILPLDTFIEKFWDDWINLISPR